MRMKKRQRMRFTGVWFAILFMFLGELFFYTWCRVNTIRLGYEVAAESERKGELQTYQSNLKIELARLKSPERIAHIARKQLGLSMPKADQTIIMP